MLRYTLRQLEYAFAIAELGSVAKAALRLRVAQPSVSASLQKLEAQLGLQIFIRHHAQGVTPTPQGLRFLDEARSLLAQARIFSGRRPGGHEVAGELTLGCLSPSRRSLCQKSLPVSGATSKGADETGGRDPGPTARRLAGRALRPGAALQARHAGRSRGDRTRG